MNRKCVINMLDLPLSTNTLVEIIRDLCDVRTSKIAIKIVDTKSYSNGTRYDITDDYSAFIKIKQVSDKTQANDCLMYC